MLNNAERGDICGEMLKYLAQTDAAFYFYICVLGITWYEQPVYLPNPSNVDIFSFMPWILFRTKHLRIEATSGWNVPAT